MSSQSCKYFLFKNGHHWQKRIDCKDTSILIQIRVKSSCLGNAILQRNTLNGFCASAKYSNTHDTMTKENLGINFQEITQQIESDTQHLPIQTFYCIGNIVFCEETSIFQTHFVSPKYVHNISMERFTAKGQNSCKLKERFGLMNLQGGLGMVFQCSQSWFKNGADDMTIRPSTLRLVFTRHKSFVFKACLY